jgi:hypothetical protein
VFKLIKENTDVVKEKFDFIDFKTRDSTSVDDSKEYVKEKRKRFKCTLSGRAVIERNQVGVWKKHYENENKTNYPEGVSCNRCSTNSNEKNLVSFEGNSSIKEKNGGFGTSNYELKGNLNCTTNSFEKNNINSVDANLKRANPIYSNINTAQNNFYETYSNFNFTMNPLQNYLAHNMNFGNFPSYGNNFACFQSNCNPSFYLNQPNSAMNNTYFNMVSKNVLEMLIRMNEMNNNKYSGLQTDINVNTGYCQGNVEVLKILKFLIVNNFIDNTNNNGNIMNDMVIGLLSGLAQQSGKL